MLTLPSLRVFIPRKKKQSLFLVAFLVVMVMLFSVSMVAKIQEVEQQQERKIKFMANPGDMWENDERQYQRVKRMNVIRETLAVEEDYSDFHPNEGNEGPLNEENKHKREGKKLQAVFNYQKNDINMPMIDHVHKDHLDASNVPLKKTASKKDRSLISQQQDSVQPFHKEIDSNGNIVFEISKLKHKREKTLVVFNKLGDSIMTGTDNSNYDETDEDNYDETQYNYNNPNPIFKDGDFDLPSQKQKLSDKKVKFFFHNPIANKVLDNPNDPALARKPFSQTNQKQTGKETHSSFQHAEPEKTWENSHQMGVRNNNDSRKAGQFVISAGAKDQLNNSRVSNQQNLLEGLMVEDHKAMVSEACKTANNCSGENKQTKKSLKTIHNRVADMASDHYKEHDASHHGGLVVNDDIPVKSKVKPPVLLNNPNDVDQLNRDINNNYMNKISGKDPESFPKSSHLKNNLEPNMIIRDTVNNDKIETQIPIQDGAAPVAVEYPATQLQHPGSLGQRIDLMNKDGLPLVVDKVYWAKEVMDLVPRGISEKEFQQFLTDTSQQPIVLMESPTWRKCGRPKNQFVQLDNGRHMCARYRDPHYDLVQGEILSFYLSRFLGFDNIPPVVLARVDSNSTQWQKVKHHIPAADWSEQKLVALIMWIQDIGDHVSTKMPSVILKALEGNYTVTLHDPGIQNMTANQLSEVIQWGDMLLFDYIIGHYDRVASMQDGAVKEKDPLIMHEDIRNLRKDAKNRKLWLIDNECGLLDGYELMYNSRDKLFYNFHRQMLQTMCIFNKQTVDKIMRLSAYAKPHELLVSYALKQEPLYQTFPREHRIHSIFEKYFHTRLKEVIEWINDCKNF